MAAATPLPAIECPLCFGARRIEGVIRSTQTIEVYTCPACAGYGLALEADCWNCGETVVRPRRVKVTADEKLETTCAECADQEATR